MINSQRLLDTCLWQGSVCREGRIFGADRVLVGLMAHPYCGSCTCSEDFVEILPEPPGGFQLSVLQLSTK